MSNNILKYTSKDYNSIVSDLIEAIPSLTSLWTSREDGDPGIVLVKLMSALGDMISYNLDKQALEYYAPTVTQRKNASMLFKLIGYNMHWYRAAVTQVTFENRAVMPDYITYLKQIVDIYNSDDSQPTKLSKIALVVQQYKNYFGNSATDTGGESDKTICIPPVINTTGDVALPQSMIDAGVTRFTFNYNNVTANEFMEPALSVYSYWQKDNIVGIHTFIADPARSIELYSDNLGGVTYSILPTTEPKIDNNGNYSSTVDILPYEPLTIPAIQGYLSSTTFSSNQIHKNRFYIPNSNIDETHLYLSYNSDSENGQQSAPIFIDMSENLLLETDGQLHFQFRVDEFDYPYIELSSYWSEILGESNVTFTLYYFRTLGKDGSITENYLNRANTNGGSYVNITNLANSSYLLDTHGNIITSPGYNPQTASDAYIDSQDYIMTYNTLVTIYDFQRFCRRQSGISNSFACDGQYASDLNDNLLTLCNSYTYEQLVNILGIEPPIGSTKETLANALYNIQKINSTNKDNCLTLEQATQPSGTASGDSETPFTAYSINIYPIWGDYTTKDQNNVPIAVLDNTITTTGDAPYKIYRIYTEEDTIDEEQLQISTFLDKQFDSCRIVNVLPKYVGLRVFDWRCCGTIHLTKSVSSDDAKTIIQNVVTALAKTYSPYNVVIGQKVNYMDVIDTILSADSRIRYFDAGLGSKKLIEFENLVQSTEGSTYVNTEAYFNNLSIMRYVQTYDEISSTTSSYYNYITIDPRYIQV